MSVQKLYPYILVIGSVIGLLASFILTTDTVAFIRNPNVDLVCNLNPLISCTSVASTWQSEVFGFMNSLLGIAAFSMLFAVGVMLLSGGRSKKPLWLLVNLGTLAAMIFVIWFFFESVYRISSLCLYCMVTWAVTWPLFLYTTIWNYREEHFKISPPSPLLLLRGGETLLHFISKYHLQVLTVGYLIPILLILWRFREFFFS